MIDIPNSADVPADALCLYRIALKSPLLDVPEEARFTRGPDWILQRLPQRPPFLFIDGVQAIRDGVLCARFDIDQTRAILAAHFPSVPRWPGVLQIEAMSQAGLLLYIDKTRQRRTEVAAGVIREARFIRPVTSGRPVQLMGAFFEDGLWTTIVGQTLQGRRVCSVSIASFL